MKKISKIIKSYLQPNTAMDTKPYCKAWVWILRAEGLPDDKPDIGVVSIGKIKTS